MTKERYSRKRRLSTGVGWVATTPETWAERIGWIAKRFADDSMRALGREVGVTGQAISKWARGESEPGGAALASIIERYPRINPQWLLTGLGPRERPTGEGDPAAVAITDALARIRELAEHLAADYGVPGPNATASDGGGDEAEGQGAEGDRPISEPVDAALEAEAIERLKRAQKGRTGRRRA